MRKVRDDLYIIDADVDVVLDEEQGQWYLQKYSHDGKSPACSKLTWPSKEAAYMAYNNTNIEWEN